MLSLHEFCFISVVYVENQTRSRNREEDGVPKQIVKKEDNSFEIDGHSCLTYFHPQLLVKELMNCLSKLKLNIKYPFIRTCTSNQDIDKTWLNPNPNCYVTISGTQWCLLKRICIMSSKVTGIYLWKSYPPGPKNQVMVERELLGERYPGTCTTKQGHSSIY